MNCPSFLKSHFRNLEGSSGFPVPSHRKLTIMKGISLVFALFLFSCKLTPHDETQDEDSLPIEGTWKLLTGTTISKGDTTTIQYTQGQSFIKIINKSHFAFMDHDLDKGKDSASAIYVSGGGPYTLNDTTYTEHLEYCSDRQWEGHDFGFTVSIHGDTLIQKGVEKAQDIGVNRINIEKYVRLNP